jgi:DNA replication initiation complex subunit (GINS family)
MTEKPAFTYETIRQIQIKEMKSSSLTRLEPDFYQKFFEHLANLEGEYQRLLSRSQNESGTVMLGEEIRKLKSLINTIHERRERKIIFLAQVEARGGQPNTKNLTELEGSFYNELVPILKRTRSRLTTDGIKDSISVPRESGSDNEGEPVKINENVTNDKPHRDPGESKKGGPPKIVQTDSTESSDDEYTLVQILQDVEPFQDENSRNYHLKKEDVLNLPNQYAKILVKRGVAKKIDMSI